MKIYVHDFSVDYLGGPDSGDVCCGTDIYYTFEKEYDLPYVPNSSFLVYVGTPKGIADYLERLIDKGIIQQISFFRSLIVVKEFDENKVFSFIKNHIENIHGRDEKELIIRAMEFFDINEETYRVDDIYSYLLYKK